MRRAQISYTMTEGEGEEFEMLGRPEDLSAGLIRLIEVFLNHIENLPPEVLSAQKEGFEQIWDNFQKEVLNRGGGK